jgi:hypothetical protein
MRRKILVNSIAAALKATCAAPPCKVPSLCRGRRPHPARRSDCGRGEVSQVPTRSSPLMTASASANFSISRLNTHPTAHWIAVYAEPSQRLRSSNRRRHLPPGRWPAATALPLQPDAAAAGRQQTPGRPFAYHHLRTSALQNTPRRAGLGSNK